MTEREFLLNEYEKQRKDYFEKKNRFSRIRRLGVSIHLKLLTGCIM